MREIYKNKPLSWVCCIMLSVSLIFSGIAPVAAFALEDNPRPSATPFVRGGWVLAQPESGPASQEPASLQNTPQDTEYTLFERKLASSDSTPTVSMISAELQYALKLLENNTLFSEISEQNKVVLCNTFHINSSVMAELEVAGLGLANSLLYAQLEYKYGFLVYELLASYPTLEDCQRLEAEMNKLYNFNKDAQDNIVFNQLKQYIFDGYSSGQVNSAYAISSITGIEMRELITPSVKGFTDNSSLDQEIQDLAIYADIIGVDSKPLQEYAAAQDCDDSTMILKITKLLSYQALGIAEKNTGQAGIANNQPGSMQNTMSSASAPSFPAAIDEIRASQVVAPFTYDANSAEQINMNTGALTHTVVDVSIPGVNGLDLVIARRYDSSESNVYNPGAYTMEAYTLYGGPGYIYNSSFSLLSFWYEAYYSDGVSEVRLPEYDDPVFNAKVNGVSDVNEILLDLLPVKAFPFGDGTIIFRLQYQTFYNCVIPPTGTIKIGKDVVETGHAMFTYASYNNNNYYNDLYGLGYGWSFAFSSIQTIDQTKYLHLSDGSTFEINSTFVNGSSNLKECPRTDIRVMAESGGYNGATHTLYHKDGKKEHFDKDGKLIAIRDRFNNNTITFTHEKVNGLPKITIIDTLNNTVVISGQSNGTNRIMTVQTPDGNYVYNVEKAPNYFDNNISGYVLASVKNPLNQITEYGYSIDRTLFNLFQQQVHGSPRDKVSTTLGILQILPDTVWNDVLHATAGRNYSVNLNKISYPTSLKTQYTYEKYIENQLKEGVQEVFRVSSRFDSEGSNIYNEKTYSFPAYSANGPTGATGYPAFLNDIVPQNLPGTYTYMASCKEESTGLVTNLLFNNNHLPINSEELLNGIITKTQALTYDSNRLPATIDTRTYNGTDFFQTIEAYEYDNKGNITASWSPLANGNTSNTEYKTTYTYDSTYSLPLTKVYKQDTNTTITEQNTVSGTNIIRQEVLVNTGSGNVTKSKAEYDYDTFGNITVARKYEDDLLTYVQTEYTYQNNAYLSEIKDAGIRNSDGNYATETPLQAAGTIVSRIAYDNLGRPITMTDANNHVTGYAYNALGHITQQTNPDYTTITYNRDYILNRLTVKDENNTQIRYDYTPAGLEDQVVDVQSGMVLSHKTYDNLSRLQTEADLLNGATTTYEYDHYSRVTEKTTRDSLNALLAQETYAYDDANSNGAYQRVQKTVVGESNAPSIVTVQYTDNMGRVVQEGRLLGGTEYIDYYTYDYIGNKTQERLAYAVAKNLPYSAKWEYDFAGRVTKAYNADGGYTTNSYNAQGQLTSATDLAGTATTYTYDAIDRLLEEKTPIEQIGGTVYNTINRYDYDPAGNITSSRASNNQLGSATTWARTDNDYNNRGRLEFVTQYDGANIDNVTKYTYDGAGNTITMRTGMSSKLANDGQQTAYTYDRLGRILTLTDPLNQQETYTYKNNGLGLLNTKTDRNGNVNLFSYDALGRILSQQVTTPENVSETNNYTYYATGAKKTEANPTVSTTFYYDSMGRLTGETDVSGGVSTVKQYTYDTANNRLTFTATAGGTSVHNTAYTYDNQNRLKTVSDYGSLKATYNYNANGARSSLVYSNGTSEHYTYNLANWLTRLENRSGVTVISAFDYTYYADGNQRTKTDHNNRVTTYAYDGAGRLASENESTGFSAAYTYDRFSNRSTMAVADTNSYTIAYTYDANNRLTQDVKTAGSAVTTGNYFYDPNGNQLAKATEILTPAGTGGAQLGIDPGGVELYDYDGFNRMVRSNVNGEVAEYTYRADGLRNSKETTAGKTTHLWDGSNIAADMNGNALVARYLRGIGLLMSDSSAGQKFYLYNGHGDVVQLASTGGVILWEYDYDAFGNEREIAGQDSALDSNPFRYCGEYFDKENGSIYMRARYYSPVLGRFRTEDTHWNPGNMIYGDSPVKNANYGDPLGLGVYVYVPNIYAIRQSGNLYAYGLNNPVSYKDSTGNVVETAFDIVSFVWSLHDMVYDPSWGNAGFLLWDAASILLPFVPGSYTVKGGIKTAEIVSGLVTAGVKLTRTQKAFIAITRGEKLTNAMKDALRIEARTIMQPAFGRALRSGKKIDAIHHIIPLEYAHLFGKNPNELSNLAGVTSKVHGEINAIWNKFRASNHNPTVKQVMDKVKEINNLYGSQFMR